MSHTKTVAKTIAETIRWTLIGLLVAAYLLGSAIAGMDGYQGPQSRMTETQLESAQRVAVGTAGSLKARQDWVWD